jgi:uncharacterized membrane protein
MNGAPLASHEAHLWAIAYNEPNQAERARAEVTTLAGAGRHLRLFDVAILSRTADGSFTLDRKPFPVTSNVLAGGTLGFLAGLALASPMTSAAIGALLGSDAQTVANAVGVEDPFIQDVERLMKPGTTAMLVLDDQGDLEAILHAIRGLGGTVLKTNVNLERAKLIQATLSAEPVQSKADVHRAKSDRAPTPGGKAGGCSKASRLITNCPPGTPPQWRGDRPFRLRTS